MIPDDNGVAGTQFLVDIITIVEQWNDVMCCNVV